MIESSRPYPGLRPFQRDESDIFFGRTRQIDELLDRLDRQHFVAVTGPSGCGKSSLVQAGLIAGLESGLMLKAGARWRVAGLRPGNNPLRSLAERLLDASALAPERGTDPNAAEHLLATLRRGPLGLVEALRQTPLPERTNLLLLVDQFEELFRYQESKMSVTGTSSRKYHPTDEAAAFVALLLATVAERSTPIYIVITMRSDYLGHCSMFTGLPEAINESQYLTPRLTRDQCREAIVGPARMFGGDVEEALVNRILNDMGPDPDQLPLMQHALMRMWTLAGPEGEEDDAGVGRTLTLDQYEKLGGLGQALSEHADKALQKLDAEGQRIAEILFKSLTERSPDHPDARRPTTVEAVASVARVPWQEIARVADVFRGADRSFITPSGSQPLQSSDTLDISHESLIRQWVKLSEWVEAEAYSAWRFRRLREQAGLWKKKEGDLWEALDLERDLAWRQKEKPTPDWAERYGGGFALAMEFLDASEKAAAEKKKAETAAKQHVQRTRRELLLTRAVVVLALAVVTAVAVAAFSMFSDQLEARRRLTNAGLEKSGKVPDEQRAGDILTSLAAVLRSSEYDWRTGSYLTNTLLQKSWALPVFVVKTEQTASSLAVSRDGRRVLAVVNGVVRLWDASRRDAWQAITWPSDQGRVYFAALSPDGEQVLTVGAGTSAELWNAKDRKAFPLQHNSEVSSGAFSADGRRIVTTTADGMVWVWDAASRSPVRSVSWRRDTASQGLSSADATAPTAPTAQTGAEARNARAGNPTGPSVGPRGPMVSAALSLDGNRLITAAEDGTVQLWHVAEKDRPGELMDQSVGLLSVAFSPDDQPDRPERILGAFGDDTVVHEVNERGQRLDSAGGTIRSASFSPNGRWLTTVSGDNGVRVWQSRTRQRISEPLRHCSRPAAAAVTDDGRWLVTACDNGVWMWDVTSGRAVSTPLRHEARINATAFSSDGRLVVTGSDDGKAQLWEVTGKRFGPPLIHPQQPKVYSVAFDPTNRLVVTSASDGTVRVWDVSNQKPVDGPAIQDSDVRSATFRCPDAASPAACDQLVTATANGTLRVWNKKTGQSIGEPLTLGGPVRSAAFSLDGRLVVTVSDDGKTTRVWNTIDGQPIGLPIQPEVEVSSAAISPLGRRVITTSGNGQATLWHVASARIIGKLTGIGSASFSPDGRKVMILNEPTAVGFAYVLPEGPEDVPLFSGMVDRVWGFFRGPSKNVALLADLAEAVSGFAEDTTGTNVLVGDPVGRLNRLRRDVAGATESDEIAWIIRWFLADRCERSVSPLFGTGGGQQRPAGAEDPSLRISCSSRQR